MTSGTSTTHKRRKTGDSDDGKVNLDVLYCKICFDPLTVPVYQCKNGHAVCGNCRKKLDKCPTCRLQVDSRCRPLEEMMESVKVKCKNWDHGCKELIRYCDRDGHEKSCIHAKYLCRQPACKTREARHDEVRLGLLRVKELLSVKVSSLVAQSADLKRSNQELSEKLSRREAELSARVSSLVTQKDELGRTNLGLTKEMGSLKQSRAKLLRVNGGLSSELARVKDELQVQVATSESLHQGHQKMERELSSSHAQIMTEKGKMQLMETEMRERDQVTKRRQMRACANQELYVKLSQREAALSARVSSLVAQNDNLCRTNLGLTDELSSLKQSRAELQRLNKDTSRVLAHLKDELQVQVATLYSLRQGHQEIRTALTIINLINHVLQILEAQ